MDKDQPQKKMVYSETVNLQGLEAENEALTSSLEKLEQENKVISTTLNRLEEESAVLRELFHNVNTELTNLKKPALLVAEIMTIIENNKAVIKLPNGNKFYCYISKDVQGLQCGESVLVDQKSLNIMEKIEFNSNLEIEKFVIINKPKESWKEIGGLKEEVQEVKEVIELPLKKPKLFEKVGIIIRAAWNRKNTSGKSSSPQHGCHIY